MAQEKTHGRRGGGRRRTQYPIELKDVGLVTHPVALIALDIDGHIRNGSKPRNRKLSSLLLIDHNHPLLPFAVFCPEVTGHIKAFA